MNELIQKMLKIERYLARKKGEFKLFALFLREESPFFLGVFWDFFCLNCDFCDFCDCLFLS